MTIATLAVSGDPPMVAVGAQPPSGGRQPSGSPGFRAKSFSDLFSSSSQHRMHVEATLSTHRGEPAISFARDAIEAIAQPFQFALVGKFSRTRPAMTDIRKFFLSLDLKGSYSIGLMDGRHVLIKLHNEADFMHIWTRNIWYIHGSAMRVFKWTTSFHVAKESSLAAVWFSLSKLPVNLLDKYCLFKLVSCLVSLLLIDAATATLSIQGVAHD